jgi:hypothetical protein
MNETSAACAALVQSLAYYRKAVAAETGTREYVSDERDDDGMQEIRARSGCTKTQFN